MMRRTKKMVAVENKFHQPLQTLIPPLVTDHGLTWTAEHLGVSKATLGYWILKLGLQVHRICLAPGETFEVKRNPIQVSYVNIRDAGST